MDTNPPTFRRAFYAREAGVLWVLWLTYGSFYFCRTNLAVALPGIEAELGYTKAQLGTVLMALKLTYGIGQFLNGQLAERVSPRKLLAAGMFGSAFLNVIFGLQTAFYFLLFVWACNGYAQALGWTPTMRVAADWFPPAKRGRAVGLIFAGHRAPVIVFLLMALGLFGVAYDSAIHAGLALSGAVLFLIGFCIFGAQVLLVGTFPVDLARRGTAAAAAGFVDFMGVADLISA